MTIQEAVARAVEVREKYAQLEKQNTGKPWTRQELFEGFVGDVGDLAKLVMAKEGRRTIDDVDAKLAHELADCFWSVLVLASKYDIDIESAFQNTMNALDANITSELQK